MLSAQFALAVDGQPYPAGMIIFALISLGAMVPGEIIGQIVCCDALEASDPLFESTVMGVDVLNMPDVFPHPFSGGEIDRLVADIVLARDHAEGIPCVAAEDAVLGQDRANGRLDCPCAAVFEHTGAG